MTTPIPTLPGAIRALRDLAGLNNTDLSRLFNTTPQTVSRWASAGGFEPPTERLQEILLLAYLVEQLAQVAKPSGVRTWLYYPHERLHGDSPAEYIQQGKLSEIRRIVDQTVSSAYV